MKWIWSPYWQSITRQGLSSGNTASAQPRKLWPTMCSGFKTCWVNVDTEWSNTMGPNWCPQHKSAPMPDIAWMVGRQRWNILDPVQKQAWQVKQTNNTRKWFLMTFCYAYRLVPRPIVVSRASYIIHCDLRSHPQPRNKIINMKPIAVVDKVRLLLFRRFHSSKKNLLS